jgi:hypothetical protein
VPPLPPQNRRSKKGTHMSGMRRVGIHHREPKWAPSSEWSEVLP